MSGTIVITGTVKVFLPGSMDTQIFNKMDLSENTPAAYDAPSRPSTPLTCSRSVPIPA